VNDKDMKNDYSQQSDQTKIDIPSSTPPDGNWKTIDLSVLFDTDKCDLTGCDLNDVYRILE
jgi:hypothetical protein